MNNQERFITQVKSTKSKFAKNVIVFRKIFQILLTATTFFSLFLIWFLLFFCFLLWFILIFVCRFCLKQKIYILIHIRLCGLVRDEKFFTQPISGNMTTFYGLISLPKSSAETPKHDKRWCTNSSADQLSTSLWSVKNNI